MTLPAQSGLTAMLAARVGVETERFDPREDADLVREMRAGRDLKENAGGVALEDDEEARTENVCAPVMVMALKTYSGRELLSRGSAYFTPVNGEATARLWEKRLHRGPAIMKHVFTSDAVKGVRVKGRLELGSACDACARGKAHRRVFRPSAHPAKEPGERLVMDVIGPAQVVGLNGEKYIVNIVDKYSGYTYTEAVNLKSDVTQVVIKLVKFADRINRLKAVMWDGGSEFENEEMTAAMAALGIPILRNAPYTPQEVSLAERNGKQIVTDIRVHLIESGVEPQYWPFILRHVVVLMNITPKKRLVINGRVVTPIEAWKKVVPDLSGVRQTGCLVYWFDAKYKTRLVEVDDEGTELKLGKWNANGQQGTLLGFADESCANYNIIRHTDGQVATVTSCRFVEDVKPCLHPTEHEQVEAGLVDHEAVNDIHLLFPDPPIPQRGAPVSDVPHSPKPVSYPPSGGSRTPDFHVESKVGGGGDGLTHALEDLDLRRDEESVLQDAPRPCCGQPKGGLEIDEAEFKYDPLSMDDGASGREDPEWRPRAKARPQAEPASAPKPRPSEAVAGGPRALNGEQARAPYPQPAETPSAPDRKEPVERGVPPELKVEARPPPSSSEVKMEAAPPLAAKPAAEPSSAARLPPSRIPVRGKGSRARAEPGSNRELASLGVPDQVPKRRANQGRPPLRLGQPYGCVNTTTRVVVEAAANASKAAGEKPKSSALALADFSGLNIREADIVIPTTWEEMKASPLYPYWAEAYEREVKLWLQRKVYEVVDHGPPHVRLTCKPVCTVKAVDGIAKKLKVRIVVREFSTGHDEFFWSPTAECHTQRILAAFAAAKGMVVSRFDVVGAYLYAALDEPVLVRAPNWPVCVDMPAGAVLQLKRAVYGMRLAAHAWNDEYNDSLVEYGWEPSVIDPALYVYRQHGDYMLATLHVDDFIVAHRQGGRFDHFVTYLTSKYDVTYDPLVTKGVGFEWMRRGIHGVVLHQRSYIDELVAKYRPLARPAATPTFSTQTANGLLESELLSPAAGDLMAPPGSWCLSFSLPAS